MTKQERKEYNKKYSKAYRESNKESEKERMKKYRESCKHSHLVYLLVNENYVGTTNSLSVRLAQHHHKKDRNISDVIILGSFSNRECALELEEALHNEGYKGKHTNNVYM